MAAIGCLLLSPLSPCGHAKVFTARVHDPRPSQPIRGGGGRGRGGPYRRRHDRVASADAICLLPQASAWYRACENCPRKYSRRGALAAGHSHACVRTHRHRHRYTHTYKHTPYGIILQWHLISTARLTTHVNSYHPPSASPPPIRATRAQRASQEECPLVSALLVKMSAALPACKRRRRRRRVTAIPPPPLPPPPPGHRSSPHRGVTTR